MTNQQLINNSTSLFTSQAKQPILPGQTAVSPNALLQRVDNGQSKLVAYLIAERQPKADKNHADLLALVNKIEATFNLDELQNLTFQLNVNFEDLAGNGRNSKIREFVAHMERRGRLPALVRACAELRPHIKWETEAIQHDGKAIIGKLDLAIVVDIARPILSSVAQYLDNRGNDANFILLRHMKPGTFFSTNDDWQSIAITFSSVMGQVQHQFSGAHLHFFMAGPGALLFAMGCIWGTVHEATVYHYENNTFYPVLDTSRGLREVTKGW